VAVFKEEFVAESLAGALQLNHLIAEEPEAAGDIPLHVGAFDHGVQKSMLQQKLAALETFGKLLADGLLDHARAREADERARLADVEVAQHGEAGGDAARGRVRQYADV